MSADLNKSLAAAHAEVKAEIARTDTKTSLLLAFIGALLAGMWTVAKDASMPIAAYVVGGAGVALLLVRPAPRLRLLLAAIGGESR
ncbi:hypothetical protein [Streptomyces sp. NBC_01317]|uniref:hypothetical protein n=1 Tax=Streptomyces sp. NBC_01317 TaxID=2903822 RepID=UPI003FA391BE